jgi:hypothetical protein
VFGPTSKKPDFGGMNISITGKYTISNLVATEPYHDEVSVLTFCNLETGEFELANRVSSHKYCQQLGTERLSPFRWNVIKPNLDLAHSVLVYVIPECPLRHRHPNTKLLYWEVQPGIIILLCSY